MKKRIISIIVIVVTILLLIASCASKESQIAKLDGNWVLQEDRHRPFNVYLSSDGESGSLFYFAHKFSFVADAKKMVVTTNGWGGTYTFDIPYEFDGDDLILDLSSEAGFYSLTGKWRFIRAD